MIIKTQTDLAYEWNLSVFLFGWWEKVGAWVERMKNELGCGSIQHSLALVICLVFVLFFSHYFFLGH